MAYRLTATASGARADCLFIRTLYSTQLPKIRYTRFRVANLLRLPEMVSWIFNQSINQSMGICIALPTNSGLYCAAKFDRLSQQPCSIGLSSTPKLRPRLSDTSTYTILFVFLRAFYKHKVKEKARFLPFLASNRELLDTASFSISSASRRICTSITTRSSATAEKQRVSSACLPMLAN